MRHPTKIELKKVVRICISLLLTTKSQNIYLTLHEYLSIYFSIGSSKEMRYIRFETNFKNERLFWYYYFSFKFKLILYLIFPVSKKELFQHESKLIGIFICNSVKCLTVSHIYISSSTT